MYIAQTTKDRIKQICKQKKINAKQMLNDCSLGVNAIQQITDTKGMASHSLAKIADYLDCSVDYLLGRTETIELTDLSEEFINATIKQFPDKFKEFILKDTIIQHHKEITKEYYFVRDIHYGQIMEIY